MNYQNGFVKRYSVAAVSGLFIIGAFFFAGWVVKGAAVFNHGDKFNHGEMEDHFDAVGRGKPPIMDERALSTAGIDSAESMAPLSTKVQTTASLIGKFTEPFSAPVVASAMSLLFTGDVMMWDTYDKAAQDSWLWNPKKGFTKVPANPANPFCSGHVGLGDGRLAVMGGHDAVLKGTPGGAIYSPLTKTWIKVGASNIARWYPTATTLGDGKVLVVSGITGCVNCEHTNTPEIFNPADNSWTELGGAVLDMPLYPHMFLLPSGKVAFVGAVADATPTKVLDITTQTWTTISDTTTDGGSSVMYEPGKILKTGSATGPRGTGDASSGARTIDFNSANPTWTEVAPMNFPRGFHTLVLLPDGTVLVSGGVASRTAGDEAKAVYAPEIWDPKTNVWSVMAPSKVVRSYHSTAILLLDGRILIGGSGGCCGVTDQFNAEIFSPPYLFKGQRPDIKSIKGTIGYGTQFTAQITQSRKIASIALIRNGSVTHGFDQNQRYIPLAWTVKGNTFSITSPLNANIAPPGYYMLFVTNTNGIPSIGKFIKIGG